MLEHPYDPTAIFGDTIGKVSCSVFWLQISSFKLLFILSRIINYTRLCYRYQDDWLKTAANSLQIWEKAPLEPYAMQKHVRSQIQLDAINS